MDEGDGQTMELCGWDLVVDVHLVDGDGASGDVAWEGGEGVRVDVVAADEEAALGGEGQGWKGLWGLGPSAGGQDEREKEAAGLGEGHGSPVVWRGWLHWERWLHGQTADPSLRSG